MKTGDIVRFMDFQASYHPHISRGKIQELHTGAVTMMVLSEWPWPTGRVVTVPISYVLESDR